jgi:recombinational DNA repair protein (RecF pathway)
MRFEDEPAYVLEARPYRETSLLLELLTAHHGRLATVARGVRGGSRTAVARRAALEPFRRIRVAASGRGEVLSLGTVESDGPVLRLAGAPLFSAWYVNELVFRLTGRGDPAPDVFHRYSAWLAELAGIVHPATAVDRIAEPAPGPMATGQYISAIAAAAPASATSINDAAAAAATTAASEAAGDAAGAPTVETEAAIAVISETSAAIPTATAGAMAPASSEADDRLAWSLRRFERDLIDLLGYALTLDHDCESGRPLRDDVAYCLDPERGARPWTADSHWPRASAEVLRAWAAETQPSREHLRQLKPLARALVRHYLGGGELRAWRLAAQWRV